MVVPAPIAAGPILYHGRSNDPVPVVPLALDFEHAYLFCRGACYVLSFQAKRDLRLVYFNGSIAAKMEEARVRLDFTGLVTSYDPTLSSLVEARHVLERNFQDRCWWVLAVLKIVLTREQGGQSGVVWGTITRVVTKHYAEPLDYLQFLLSPEAGFADAAQQAARARARCSHARAIHYTCRCFRERLPASLITPQEVRIRRSREYPTRDLQAVDAYLARIV